MKTSELTGAALVRALAKCENVELDENNKPIWFGDDDERVEYTPPTDWAQGGPIIERMRLNRLTTNVSGGYTASVKVTLTNTDDDFYIVWASRSGPTPLIAAMRCYVASKLGDIVEVPKELI